MFCINFDCTSLVLAGTKQKIQFKNFYIFLNNFLENSIEIEGTRGQILIDFI